MQESEFESLFWTLQPQLLRFATRQLDASLAEDVVAEALTTLWVKDLPFPATEQEQRQVRSFAFTILVGHIRNEQRSRRRLAALAQRQGAHLHTAPGGVAVATESAVDAVAENDAVLQVLGRLSAEDREVILLFNAGFSIEESAQILGCSAAAASKRRTRAKNRLRTIIKNQGGVSG